MVKKGKSGYKISLDPIHHLVSVGSVSLELKPLTYALFAKLVEHKNEIVPIGKLTEEVWGSVTVAPDTLKQRVFLLRKALENAGVSECQVQSVRGFGYRLIVPDRPSNEAQPAIHRYRLWAGASLLIVALLAVYFFYSRQTYELPSNSRVVFWTTPASTSLSNDVRAMQQEWITLLSTNDHIQYLASGRDTDHTLSAQARLTRAALISRWVLFDNGVEQNIRMQIIEPKTATPLRSDIVNVDDGDEFSVLLRTQAEAIERILDSDALPLTRDALNDTDHPAWSRLRILANESNLSNSQAE